MMIINKKSVQRIVLDLKSSDGNIYVIRSKAIEMAKYLGWTKEELLKLTKEMKESPYPKLVAIVEYNFGNYMDLIMEKSFEKKVNVWLEEFKKGNSVVNWLGI